MRTFTGKGSGMQLCKHNKAMTIKIKIEVLINCLVCTFNICSPWSVVNLQLF